MIVDDEILTHRILKYLLQPKYEVYSKPNGREAFDFLMMDGLFDLIITDVEMPLLNGKELIEKLNARSSMANIPVIMISGNEEFDPTSLIHSNQIRSFMRKPIETDLFKTEIANLLDQN